MRIVISGASGFVGNHLQNLFAKQGWQVVALGRKDYADAAALSQKLENADAVINLAGATIAGRWNAAYKKLLIDSRIETTRALVDAMQKCQTPPKRFLSTSAVGRFPGNGIHTEASGAIGDTFLANLTRQWEAEALKVEGLGVPVTICRFGVVLGKGGGMLGKLLPLFRWGLGGKIGSGKQGFSWIHLDDLGRIYLHLLRRPAESGVYHFCAPGYTDNAGFTKALGRALGRPAFFAVPGFVLKLALLEGASVALEGQFVYSSRLAETGFEFCYPDIDSALKSITE